MIKIAVGLAVVNIVLLIALQYVPNQVCREIFGIPCDITRSE